MNADELSQLIDRLESYSRKHPSAYRFKVAALAALGYAYLFAVVLLLLLIVYYVLFHVSFNYLTLKLVWIPLVVVGLVLRSLWVTLPEPNGQKLSPADAPKLFELISEVRSALNGPTAHHVLVSDEFNAGIVQIPKLGMFGWLRNYLVVGLPLMKALTPAEFRAVLAHEFGHLSGNHGRFSAWIYHMRQSWIQILTRVHVERHYAAFLFERFLNWYAPFFNAYSFVLARAQEYEADSHAVNLAGRETAARMLVRMNNKERALIENFWPAFYRQSHDEPEPAKNPFTQMLKGLESPVDRETEEIWVSQALKVETGHDDTHPALADRLDAMGYRRDDIEKNLPESLLWNGAPQEPSAAEYYLHTLPVDFVPTCDRVWKEHVATPWREQHELIQKTGTRLNQLEARSESGTLTMAEQWEHARCIAAIKDSAAALPVMRKLLSQNPDDAAANYAVGAILLEQGDAEGIELLEKATQLETSTTGDAFQLIYRFLRNQGRLKDAESYRTRSEEYFESLRQFEEKALTFSYRDHFEPHELEASMVVALRNQLRGIRAVEKAYLVRKVVEGAPHPFNIMGIVPTGDDLELFNELASLDYQGQMTFVLLSGKHEFLQPMFASLPGAQIFPAA